jgi:hypothetical protein
VDAARNVVLGRGDYALKRGGEVFDALVEDEGASEGVFAWWFEFEGHGLEDGVGWVFVAEVGREFEELEDFDVGRVGVLLVIGVVLCCEFYDGVVGGTERAIGEGHGVAAGVAEREAVAMDGVFGLPFPFAARFFHSGIEVAAVACVVAPLIYSEILCIIYHHSDWHHLLFIPYRCLCRASQMPRHVSIPHR